MAYQQYMFVASIWEGTASKNIWCWQQCIYFILDWLYRLMIGLFFDEKYLSVVDTLEPMILLKHYFLNNTHPIF